MPRSCVSIASTGRTDRRLVLPALLALAAGACTVAAPPPVTSLPDVSIMSFNVQNLFDTIDDPGKDDHTYLPASAKQSDAHKARCAEIAVDRWRNECLHWDWNETVLEAKLDALTRTVLAYGGGRGPDILVLQEVENLRVLERWRTGPLAAAGYRPAILLEGSDARGIDVAFLSRLEVSGEARLHAIDFEGVEARRVADTRGILEASFVLSDGRLLTGFAVHFPAPYHPHEMRIAAYQRLATLAADLPPDRLAFAAGDFNTPAEEDREHDMLDRWARSHWYVAHDAGCGACRGTYYYAPKTEWSFLDMILVAPAMAPDGAAPWRIRHDSVSVVAAAPGQRRDDGTPRAFELPAATGVSDHLPLAVRLARNPAP